MVIKPRRDLGSPIWVTVRKERKGSLLWEFADSIAVSKLFKRRTWLQGCPKWVIRSSLFGPRNRVQCFPNLPTKRKRKTTLLKVIFRNQTSNWSARTTRPLCRLKWNTSTRDAIHHTIRTGNKLWKPASHMNDNSMTNQALLTRHATVSN